MDLTQAAFDDLRRQIHRLCGIVLGDDKTYLVRNRLESVVRQCGCRDFDEFRRKLVSAEGFPLQEAVIEAITTQETTFFRDGHPFEALRQQILPDLIGARGSGGAAARPIRIWSAAVSTGQEAYSLAILLHELSSPSLVERPKSPGVSILGTDISARALATATAGVYERRQVDRGLTATQIHKYFERCGDRWVARPLLRRFIEFRRVNLVQPLGGLGVFDVILCRNVLFYFDEPTRRRICEQLFALLADGGWLLLGSAENLYGVSGRFTSVHIGDTLVYRKGRD